ncbi:MAG: ribonuclease III [Terriglobia bacterium]
MARVERGPEEPVQLEARLGYQFLDRQLLARALTHRSHRGLNGRPADEGDNERLEFLGDAILGFAVSDVLYSQFPGLSEGKLSRIKANLVNRRSLYQVADRLELGRYLRLGPGEEKTGGRKKQAILANAVEALLAAIYRDGGWESARQFVEEFFLEAVQEGTLERLVRADYKSAMQEYLQSERLPGARYRTAESHGPEHRKTFIVELWVGERLLASGQGASKKAAEQEAARRALEQVPLE